MSSSIRSRSLRKATTTTWWVKQDALGGVLAHEGPDEGMDAQVDVGVRLASRGAVIVLADVAATGLLVGIARANTVLGQTLEDAPFLLAKPLLLDEGRARSERGHDLLGGLHGAPVGGDVQDVEGAEVVQARPGGVRVLASLGRQRHVDVAHREAEMDLLRAAVLEMLASLGREALGVPHHGQKRRPLGD